MSEADEAVRISYILMEYADQESIGWPACFAYMRTYNHERIADITAHIIRDGASSVGPLYLDPFNKRVLDGHHRLAAFHSLRWAEVDVIYAAKEDLD